MSGFNTIKKSRKRSYEIEEKLNVLNRELEKTKNIHEQPTNSTGDLYTSVVATLPQDPVQVNNPDPDQSSGATTDNWTQPVGDGEDGGTAGSVPDSFPFIVPNPGYQDPTAGWYGANGEPLYDESDLPYNTPDPSDTGGVAALSGVQVEVGGMNPRVVTGYLRRDIAKDNFVSAEDDGAFIEHNGVTITFKTHPELFKPIKYWVTFSIFNPFIDAYWPNNSLGLTPQYTGVVAGSEDSNPRALFTAYKYVGGARTQTFDPVGSRGTTTPGDSKGTGDADQYPPLPWFERLGREAFERLKDFSREVEARADGLKGILDAIPPFLNFLAHQINENSPWTEENPFPVDLDDKQTEKMKNDIEEIFDDWGTDRVDEINNGSPMTNEEMNEVNNKINAQKSDRGNDALDAKYPSSRLTLNNIGNPKAFENNIKTNKDGSKTPTAINDNYVFQGDADASAPGAPKIIKTMIDNEKVQNAIKKSNLKYPYVKDNEIDYDAIIGGADTPSIFNKNMPIKVNLTTLSSFKENAYMALLDRTYKPTERDYVKYTSDTPKGRKQFDRDIKMVHEFIKKNPDKYEYVMKRYPKDDPRLSMLNYRMDRMTEASDKYLETQFPTNQTLFTKVKERTKKSMNLTDPKNFKPVKDPIKYVDVKKTKKLKETVTRHFNNPVKSKSMFGLNMGKVRKTNQKMIEKREYEQRVKEEERVYIQEKMSRQKSNWKDDLTTL